MSRGHCCLKPVVSNFNAIMVQTRSSHRAKEVPIPPVLEEIVSPLPPSDDNPVAPPSVPVLLPNVVHDVVPVPVPVPDAIPDVVVEASAGCAASCIPINPPVSKYEYFVPYIVDGVECNRYLATKRYQRKTNRPYVKHSQ